MTANTTPPAQNRVHQIWSELRSSLGVGRPPAAPSATPIESPYIACLAYIGAAIGVSWEPRQLAEALPFGQPIDGIASFRAVAKRLGCDTLVRRARLTAIASSALPCIIVTTAGPLLFKGIDAGGMPELVVPRGSGATASINPDRSYLVCFIAAKPETAEEDKSPWMQRQLVHLSGPVWAMVGLSLLINLLGLATPLFTMAVYDLAVRSGAMMTLGYLLIAALLAIGVELHLRRERSRLVAETGSRFDAALSSAIFQRILELPLRMTESAPVDAQVRRFKQFESIRAIFTGHVINALLDFPFILIMVGIIFMIAGPIGFVPIGLAAIYALIMVFVHPAQVRLALREGQAQSAIQSSLSETVSKLASIQQLGVQQGWSARISKLSSEAAEARFQLQFLDNMLQSLTQAMLMIAGILVLGIGAMQCMAGSMSMGALVGTMMLIWRVLMPIQVAFISSHKISQFRSAITQVNQIMALVPERRTASPAPLRRKIHGALRLEGLGYRHAGDFEPAIRGINLSIPAGQTVAICGASGSGKSTLLKCLAGIYEPATGAVYLDGLNLRQMRVADYRTVVGYLPPRVRLFHGNVLQNLRLIAPGTTEEALSTALGQAGVTMIGSNFPNGLRTFAKNFGGAQLDEALQLRIFLAGLYARQAPLLLLDDPGSFLDAEGDEALLAQIDRVRGKTTMILTTNRPSHMRACDRLIYLHRGSVALDGPPEKVLAAMAASDASNASKIHPAA